MWRVEAKLEEARGERDLRRRSKGEGGGRGRRRRRRGGGAARAGAALLSQVREKYFKCTFCPHGGQKQCIKVDSSLHFTWLRFCFGFLQLFLVKNQEHVGTGRS